MPCWYWQIRGTFHGIGRAPDHCAIRPSRAVVSMMVWMGVVVIASVSCHAQSIHSAIVVPQSPIQQTIPSPIKEESRPVEMRDEVGADAVKVVPAEHRAIKTAIQTTSPHRLSLPNPENDSISSQAWSQSSADMPLVPVPPAIPSAESQSVFRLASSSRLREQSASIGVSEDKPSINGSTPSDASVRQELPSEVQPDSMATGMAQDARWYACRAAQFWGPARVLLQRASTLRESAGAHSRETAQLKSTFLRHQAAWQQDLAAASALKAAYTYLALQMQMEILERGLQLVAEQEQIQASLLERKVAIADPTALERQRLELLDQRLVANKNLQQVSSTLHQLARVDACEEIAVFDSIDVQCSELMCDCLVQQAFGRRNDLASWNSVWSGLNAGTAAGVAELISSVAGNVGLPGGSANPLTVLWAKLHAGEIVERLRCELQVVIDTQRNLIRTTVCQRCQATQIAYERCQVAEQMRASWRARVQGLERLAELGDARTIELLEARGEVLRAEGTLVQRKLEARLAEVDLAEGCGGLAARCCCGDPWFTCQ